MHCTTEPSGVVPEARVPSGGARAMTVQGGGAMLDASSERRSPRQLVERRHDATLQQSADELAELLAADVAYELPLVYQGRPEQAPSDERLGRRPQDCPDVRPGR